MFIAAILAQDSIPQGTVTLTVPVGGLTQTASIAQYIGALFRYGIGIIGVIATVMIVVGGAQWLLAAGDSGKITQARERITNAMIGLLIALATTIILNTINPELLKLRELHIPSVNQAQNQLASTCPHGTAGCLCAGDDEYGEGGTCTNGLRCVATRSVVASETGSETLKRLAGDALLGGGTGFAGARFGQGVVAGLQGAKVAGAGAALPVALLTASGGMLFGSISRAIGDTQYRCTDGSLGLPCDETEDCQTGLKCHDDLKLCFNPHGQAGTLCDDGDQCPSGFSCDDNYCRGSAERGSLCRVDGECETGLRCFKPDNGIGRCEQQGGGAAVVGAGHYCVLDGVNIKPRDCSGNNFYCLFCPGSGDRNWTRLNEENDPGHERLGQCKPLRNVEGTPCI